MKPNYYKLAEDVSKVIEKFIEDNNITSRFTFADIFPNIKCKYYVDVDFNPAYREKLHHTHA